MLIFDLLLYSAWVVCTSLEFEGAYYLSGAVLCVIFGHATDLLGLYLAKQILGKDKSLWQW